MGRVRKEKAEMFPLSPESWYLVVYFNDKLEYLYVPSSNKSDLEKLGYILTVFKLFSIPYLLFGIHKGDIFELGHDFEERLKEEFGVDIDEKALTREFKNSLRSIENLKTFYEKLGFFEDLEELEDLRRLYEEYLKKKKE
ncbi:hypothetical protein [Thermococcus sp. 2319x1]|uniref:hypothetical protein n=1 Tax=Thermococcus sp. 2319x1 TaxID=1674923 RepID=UPI001582EE6C|nr:hypothetical protein [Thermococcus sp. 2319x1]